MKNELDSLAETVKYAIQMEIDGKQFYAAAGKQSKNRLGQELYAWLAAQEDHHRARFEAIYQSISQKKELPSGNIVPDRTPGPGTLFREAIKAAGKTLTAQKPELEAVEKAIEMEIKSRDYYKKQAAGSSPGAVSKFLTAVSAEEQGHYLALVDYKEYMADPAGWFTRTEHHLLDGA